MQGPDTGALRPARQHEHGHQQESRSPQPRLFAQRPVQLDEQRIAQQRGEAAEVARGVEKVWVARPVGCGRCEPLLKQRRGERQHEERGADVHEQLQQQPCGGPVLPGRGGAFVQPDGQGGQRGEQEGEVRSHLRARSEAT